MQPKPYFGAAQVSDVNLTVCQFTQQRSTECVTLWEKDPKSSQGSMQSLIYLHVDWLPELWAYKVTTIIITLYID